MSFDAPSRRPAAYAPARLAITVLVVAAAIALGLVAGRWQWGRYETKSHAQHAQEQAQGQPVAPLGALVTTADDGPGDAQWRTATATGVLEPESLMELRGRSVDGTASIQYVAWLRMGDDGSVLVNLGWAPRAESPAPPALPTGRVTVEGVVRSLEPDNGRRGTRIDPAQVGSIDGEVVPAYLMARTACGADGCMEDLEPVPTPNLSLGPHLSYALQWWLLSLVAAPVGIVLTRREAALERERWALAAEAGASGAGEPARVSDGKRTPAPSSDDAELRGASAGAEEPTPSGRRRRGGSRLWGRAEGPTDEEVEDAL